MKRILSFSLLSLILLAGCSGQEERPAAPNPTTPPEAIAADAAAWTETLLSQPFSLADDADFTLSTADGEPFTLSAQRDKITVIYFGFTSCPDVCPLTLNELKRAYLNLDEPQDALQIVLITVDPERDTPELLKNYVGRYHEDFIALTGDVAALERAYDAFGIRAEKVPLPDSAMGYTMDHSADVYIIPPDRALSRKFQHGATFSNFAHDLGMLLDHLDEMRTIPQMSYAEQLHGIPQYRAPLSDFTLTSTRDEAEFTLSEQQGKITVIYYGFTSCPDVCPLTLYELNRALETLGPLAEHVQVAMITVDPERDTPTLLKPYVERYNPNFIALYGEPEAIEAAKEVFGVLAFKQPIEGSAMGYTIDHTADIFVVGPRVEYLLRIPHGTPYTEIADDLRLIIEHELQEEQIS